MPINFAIKLAATVAIEAASVALQDSKRTKGPRLDELTVTVADYGTPLPRFRGTRRFACPVFHAEDLKEVEQTSKVKGGGKQTTYHYLATFACAIADCPIDKVLKIWFDDKLVYDVTGAGPTSVASSLGLDINSVMRIYYGSEDQLPDPRYTDWCENKYGPDSAPAYRGVSYLFFEELPVDNFGNRIPQVSVLATSGAVSAYPYEQHVTAMPENSALSISPSGNWIIHYQSPTFNRMAIEWWDTATRSMVGSSSVPQDFTLFSSNIAVGDDGTAYWVNPTDDGVGGFNISLYTVPLLSTGSPIVGDSSSSSLGVNRVLGGNVYTARDVAGYLLNGFLVSTTDCLRDVCIDADGNVWGLFQPSGSSSAFSLVDLTGSGGTHSFTAASRSGVNTAHVCYSAQTNSFLATMSGNFYIIDNAGWAITSSGVAGWGSADVLPFANPNRSTFWNNLSQYSLSDGSLIQTISASNFVVENTADATVYDPVNNASWARPDLANHLTIRFLERASGDGVTLGEIVSAMCDAAGLADRDTSLLTQIVQGYSWTRGDVKSQMEPLLDIYDVDPRPHDFSLEFLPRGTAPSGTILTSELAKSGNGPRYKVTTAQDTDLPKTLRVNFADTEFDQQANNVLSTLPTDAVDTQRDDTIDATTYAGTPDGVQQKADRYLRREWNSRESIASSLTAQKLAMEPGDVTTLSLDGVLQNARLQKQTFTEDRIDCTFVRDETSFAAINSATVGQSMDARTPQQIVIPAPVKGFVIDAPLASDADDDVKPLLYAGAGAYAGLTFPGAAIYEATGAGTSRAYDQLFASVVSGATWGTCAVALASVPSPWLWDRGNTLTVSLQSGSLTSVTTADIDADPSLNLILVGQQGAWEYLNFTTATLNGDGTYTLSGFKRGRRGTEWACSGHSTGEAWVMASSLAPEEVGTDEIGNSLSFKAQSIGRSITSAPTIDVTDFEGESLMPYAPGYVKWVYDGTDLQATIFRRTRVGGSWNGSTIPLSESSEEYEVEIYNGLTLKRTITVSGTNTFPYTAAMAAMDGTTLPTHPTIKAYQISATVGRGFALAA